MYSRRIIFPTRSVAHVFFRCHNRQPLFKDLAVKFFIIQLWAKYKKKYDIRFFDFIIMDNHVHILLRAENSEDLGNFMRTVNSQISRFINSYYKRDSQAIRERYKSPICTTASYSIQVMQYIWLNRYKVNKSKPEFDIFCSASWRLNDKISRKFHTDNDELNELIDHLLDPYEAADIHIEEDIFQFVKKLLNDALSRIETFCSKTLTHSTTIGDKHVVQYRNQLLRAFGREPPVFQR